MKKTIKTFVYLIIISTMVVSCRLIDENRFNTLLEDVPNFTTGEEAWMWVANNIDYKSDAFGGSWDTWQNPEETLALRAGDCEDRAILLMYFLDKLKITTKLILITPIDNVSILKFHVVLLWNTIYIEPSRYYFYFPLENIKVIKILANSYNEAYNITTWKKIEPNN